MAFAFASASHLCSSSPFSDLVHLRPATQLDNCPCQMGHPSWPALGPRLSGQSLYYPMVNGLARCDISHLYLTGQLKLLAIAIGLAGPVLNMNLIVD